METEDSTNSSQELLDYHKKIQQHIVLLQKIVTNIDVVDMVYRVWDWH